MKIFSKKAITKKGSVLAYVLILMFIMLAIILDLFASSVSEEKNAIINTKTDFSMSLAQEGVEDFLINAKNVFRTGANNTIAVLGSCNSSTGVVTTSNKTLTFYRKVGITYVQINDCTTKIIEVAKIKVDGSYRDTVRSFSAPVSFFTDGLIGYWKLDDGSGSTAADSSGMENDGEINGADGGDDYLSFANTDYVKIDGLFGNYQTLTLSAWVYLTGYSHTVISLGDHVLIDALSGVNPGGFYQGNPNWGSATGGSLTLNTWHQVTFAVDPNNSREEFYIDGYSRGNDTLNENIHYSGGGDTYLGINGNGNPNEDNFAGRMREVRVYNRALTDTEITSLYNATRP
jgi:hypothetical protein